MREENISTLSMEETGDKVIERKGKVRPPSPEKGGKTARAQVKILGHQQEEEQREEGPRLRKRGREGERGSPVCKKGARKEGARSERRKKRKRHLPQKEKTAARSREKKL